MSKADEILKKIDIDNNKPVNIILKTTITFYKEASQRDTFGSNNVVYELYYNTEDGILNVIEIGAFVYAENRYLED